MLRIDTACDRPAHRKPRTRLCDLLSIVRFFGRPRGNGRGPLLIVTSCGETVNALHIVRFFIQRTGSLGTLQCPCVEYRLVIQLTGRQRTVAADGLSRARAQALYDDLVRQWTQGQACIDIAAYLEPLEKDETGGDRRLAEWP